MINYLAQRPGLSLALSALGAGLMISAIVIYPANSTPTSKAAMPELCNNTTGSQTSAPFPADSEVSNNNSWASNWRTTKWLAFHDIGSGRDFPIGTYEWSVNGKMKDESGELLCFSETWYIERAVLGSTNHGNKGRSWTTTGGNLTDKPGDQVRVINANYLGQNDPSFRDNNDWSQAGLYGIMARKIEKIEGTLNTYQIKDSRSFIPVEWKVRGQRHN